MFVLYAIYSTKMDVIKLVILLDIELQELKLIVYMNGLNNYWLVALYITNLQMDHFSLTITYIHTGYYQTATSGWVYSVQN